MIRDKIILAIPHNELIEMFISFATNELGTIKMGEILSKINSSGKISKFLNEARRINQPLGSDDFLACIHASRSFVFSNAETISVASIALLFKWNIEIGIPNNLSNDVYLNKRLFSILEKCNHYKTHISSRLNFFERYYVQAEKLLIIREIDSYTSKVFTEIYFDTTLCNAIDSRVKTEFRVSDNLEGINLYPSKWIFKTSEAGNFAKFYNNILDISKSIECPFQKGSIVSVYNDKDQSKIHSKIRITSICLQRINEVNNNDVRKEGYMEYHERIDRLIERYPTLDAGLFLFNEDWIKRIGKQKFDENIWIWVFGFEYLYTSYCIPKSVSTSEKISPEVLDAILNTEI